MQLITRVQNFSRGDTAAYHAVCFNLPPTLSDTVPTHAADSEPDSQTGVIFFYHDPVGGIAT